METRARYILVGLFVLAFAGAMFGFIYWLNNSGGWRERIAYRIVFESSVSGLRVGAPVLFNGLRVGEVTGLRLDPNSTTAVIASVAIAQETPVRADTAVALIFQGLTGTAAVSLQGGTQAWPTAGGLRELRADAAAGQDLTQAARQLVSRLDRFVEENADPLKGAIADLRTFAAALARNSPQLDDLVAGVVKMTGGGTKPAAAVYDLRAPRKAASAVRSGKTTVALPDPVTIVTFDTQKILTQSDDGSLKAVDGAQWAESVPKLVQARLIESFEAAGFGGRVARPLDLVTTDMQLVLEVRKFQLAAGAPQRATITLAARLVGIDGKVRGSRVIERAVAAEKQDPAAIVAAFGDAFGQVADDLIGWAAEILERG